jgi:hypothetical protein
MRRRLRYSVRPHSFAPGKVTDEATAFMYLAQGVEEIRGIDGGKDPT